MQENELHNREQTFNKRVLKWRPEDLRTLTISPYQTKTNAKQTVTSTGKTLYDIQEYTFSSRSEYYSHLSHGVLYEVWGILSSACKQLENQNLPQISSSKRSSNGGNWGLATLVDIQQSKLSTTVWYRVVGSDGWDVTSLQYSMVELVLGQSINILGICGVVGDRTMQGDLIRVKVELEHDVIRDLAASISANVGTAWQIRSLRTSLVANQRMYDAVLSEPDVPFLPTLLRGLGGLSISGFDPLNVVGTTASLGVAEKALRNLNNSQKDAIAPFLSTTDPVIHCVQGPPGTGKTRTLAALVTGLVAQGYRCLVAAASNKAINVVANQLHLQLSEDTEDNCGHGMFILRSEERYTLDSETVLRQYYVDEWGDEKSDDVGVILDTLKEWNTFVESSLKSVHPSSIDGHMKIELLDSVPIITAIHQRLHQLQQLIRKSCPTFDNKTGLSVRIKAALELLRQAIVLVNQIVSNDLEDANQKSRHSTSHARHPDFKKHDKNVKTGGKRTQKEIKKAANRLGRKYQSVEINTFSSITDTDTLTKYRSSHTEAQPQSDICPGKALVQEHERAKKHSPQICPENSIASKEDLNADVQSNVLPDIYLHTHAPGEQENSYTLAQHEQTDTIRHEVQKNTHVSRDETCKCTEHTYTQSHVHNERSRLEKAAQSSGEQHRHPTVTPTGLTSQPDLIIASKTILEILEFTGQAVEYLYKVRKTLLEPYDTFELLNHAQVVFGTLSILGRPEVVKRLRKFDVLIVEEASQTTEVETCIGFQYNPKRLCLFGDTMQLPPTVLTQQTKSDKTIEVGYGRSLMSRLVEGCNFPCAKLTLQYRMHSEIRKFPSKRFYGNLLRDGRVNDLAQPWHSFLGPYAFVDCKNGIETRVGHSYSNVYEVNVCLNVAKHLIRHCSVDSNNQISVISFYQGQVQAINQALRMSGKMVKGVNAFSVDSYQGSECDIVILTTVRSNESQAIGFLNDFRRLNVALTRARHTLIVLGNVDTMYATIGSTVRDMVEDARARGLIYDSTEVMRACEEPNYTLKRKSPEMPKDFEEIEPSIARNVAEDSEAHTLTDEEIDDWEARVSE
eukprot:CFRG6907T1